MRLFVVQRISGAVLALSSGIMLPPLAMSWAANDGLTTVFIESFVALAVVGLLLWLPVSRVREDLRLRDGFLVVSAIWVLISLACALPFMLGPPHLSFTDAVFESTSGLTTTGATVIVGLDHLPRSMHFYRQLLCFLGGMGIVILAVAILPMLRIGGSQLFRAETTGPVKDTKLTPRIAETARALWMIYVGLNVACTIAFWVGGMSFFDAVVHAFSTVATGGFSTHDASLGHYNSPVIEAIAIVFMLLGSANFALHYVAWQRATGSIYFGDAELKAFIAIIIAISAIVSVEAYAQGVFDHFTTALRHGTFHTVSMITTTGYLTTGFAGWPGMGPMLLVLVAFIGGCSGSTTGGMKVARVVMLFRQGGREIQQLVHPKGRFVVKMGGMQVSGAVLAAVTGFGTLYVFSYILMTLLVVATGVDLVTAWTTVAAAINNVGPALGAAAVTFQDLNDAAVWICSFGMILGRLEVFTLIVLLTPTFWRE